MPPLLSCPGLHLLLPSGAHAQAPVTSCLLPKSLQLGIPEGTGSGVHASKKSQHRSVPHREARGKSKGLCSSRANSMGNEIFPQTLKWKISGETGYIPSLYVQALFLALPRVVWDLNSPTGVEPIPAAVEAQSPHRWTSWEAQGGIFNTACSPVPSLGSLQVPVFCGQHRSVCFPGLP